MINKDLKEEYLSELHKLLKVYVSRCTSDLGGIHEFVNMHIVDGSHGEYRCADSDIADGAVHAYKNINQLLPSDLNLVFNSIFFDADLQLIFAFSLLNRGDCPFQESILDLYFTQSSSALRVEKTHEKVFDETMSNDGLQSMISIVKSLSTFGLMKDKQ